MLRPSTRDRVHAAVLALAASEGYAALTMEGIAARAGAGKQTLYREWPNPDAILFDALLARSGGDDVAVPDSGDLAVDLERFVRETVAELTHPESDRLLRAVTARLQTDDALGADLLDRLLGPQLRAVAARFATAGIRDPDDAAELLLGPVLHRWLLRTRPFTPEWPAAHVARVLRGVGAPGGA